MIKASKATIARRVHEVLRLIISGAEFSDIRQYATSQGWNVSERQVHRYLEAANSQLGDLTKQDRKQLLGRHLMQRRALYARAIKNGDLRTALQVLRDEAELQGLYPPARVAPVMPDGQTPFRLAVDQMSPDQLRALVQLRRQALPAPEDDEEIIDVEAVEEEAQPALEPEAGRNGRG